MDKNVAGVIGAVSVLAAVSPSQAAPAALAEAMQVNSYADLLKPIPNALALRRAFDEGQAAKAEQPSAAGDPEVMTIQYYHHHHHRYYRRRFYHHHHHHHHHHRFIPFVR